MALSPLLHNLATKNAPQILLALRPQDPIPDWITHLIYLGPCLRVAKQGRKTDVLNRVKSDSRSRKTTQPSTEFGRKLTARGIDDQYSNRKESSEQQAQAHKPFDVRNRGLSNDREPLVEMENVQVSYGDKQVLGAWVQNVEGQHRPGLCWTVRRGQRWGVFGPNGEFHSFARHSLTVV